jgi:lactate permease
MPAALAAAPLVLIVLLMVVWRQSAAAAGVAGLVLAMGIAAAAFTVTGAHGDPIAPATAALGTGLEALHTTATILWIIFPALALYELQARAGSFDRIRAALVALSADRRTQAILIAWFFGLFMEGAAGFGTPVALAAPLLVGLGYSPVTAVALALIGHAAGVSFGALGTPVIVQADISGLNPVEIAARTGLLHAVLGLVLLVFAMRMAADQPLSRSDWTWTVLAAACFLLPFLALAMFVGPELPTLGGALVGAACFIALLRLRRRGPSQRIEGLRGDLAPYGIILILVLVTRLVSPLQENLWAVDLSWSMAGTFRGSFHPLYHPGTILLVGLLLGAAVQGRIDSLGEAALAAVRKLWPVALALAAMLGLARTMVHWGMVQALADEAARAGVAWPLLAPAIGVLGTFVTGSATASNILFSQFQIDTAAALALPPVLMAAAQGFGAAVGNIICPHNIVAGSAAVGLSGREGEILVRTATACAVYALAGGALILAASVTLE